MKTKRIVITGGPGSGKTSLINFLEGLGHTCMQEVSREVILNAQEEGIDQLFLHDPILFSELLLKGRLEQFRDANSLETEILFYDRGLPDVPAYLHYQGTNYPSFFDETCKDHRYDAVFLLPPWEAIYTQDNERYETYDQAEAIFNHLHKTYEEYDYKVHHVPTGSLEYRSQHILEIVKELS